MVASPLPNREYRHLIQFHVAPKLDYVKRLVLAGGFILAGVAFQLLAPTNSVAVLLAGGLPLLFIGNLFLLARGYDLSPSQSHGRGTWEKTTRDRFSKMRDLEREVKRWDESFTDVTCVSGIITLVMIVIVIVVICWMMGRSASTRMWMPIFAADAAVLLLPHWFTGTRSAWRPLALRQTIDALDTAVSAIDQFESPPCQIQPLFEMAGKGERRWPIDARVFIRFPDGPAGFRGVQFQVAINNVQGTNYPYLYAVLVAKDDFGLLENHLDKIERQLGGSLTVESKRADDVEVIIIRQPTTRNSGYHTGSAVIRRIALAAWQGAELIVRG